MIEPNKTLGDKAQAWLKAPRATVGQESAAPRVVYRETHESAREEAPVWNGQLPGAGASTQAALPQAAAAPSAAGHPLADPNFRAVGGAFADPPKIDIGEPKTMNDIAWAAHNLCEPVKAWVEAGQKQKIQAADRGDVAHSKMAPEEYEVVGGTLTATVDALTALTQKAMALAEKDPDGAGKDLEHLLPHLAARAKFFNTGVQFYNDMLQSDQGYAMGRTRQMLMAQSQNSAQNLQWMFQQSGRMNFDMNSIASDGDGDRDDRWSAGGPAGVGMQGAWGGAGMMPGYGYGYGAQGYMNPAFMGNPAMMGNPALMGNPAMYGSSFGTAVDPLTGQPIAPGLNNGNGWYMGGRPVDPRLFR